MPCCPRSRVPSRSCSAGAVCGIGFGLFKSPNDRELMMSAPRELSSSASGVLASVRSSGQAVGAALVAIIFAAYGASLAGASADAAIGRAAHAALLARLRVRVRRDARKRIAVSGFSRGKRRSALP